MYLQHWGLTKMPFENTNDLSFFYFSSKHKEALARMRYAVLQKKIGMMLTGEYGAGKTFLSHALTKMCVEEKSRVSFITNPRLEPIEFLREVNYHLGGEVQGVKLETKTEILRSIFERLKDYSLKGVHPVLVMDEAQSINDDNLLEEIRLLLNMQEDEEVLFTLILAGQTQLEEKVDRLPQLKQRMAIRYNLAPLTEMETKEYIEFRLKVAGNAERKIFTELAYQHVYHLSLGMPRAINNVCDLALLTGFIKKSESIDDEMISHVGQDLNSGK